MFKYLIALSVIALSTSFLACGGKSGNPAIPPAPLVQDEGEIMFSGDDVKVMAATDPAVQPVSQTDVSCADKNGAGHKIVDARLVPKTLFEKTIKAGQPGDKDARTFAISSTILTNTIDSYSRRDVYKIPGNVRTDLVNCDFKSVTGPWLNCLDQRSVKVTKASLRDTTNEVHCHVAWSHDEKDNKTTFQTKIIQISGKQIHAFRKVVEHDGLLTCNNRPIGQGKTIESYVYTYDIPSLVKDSCAPAEIYFHYAKMDNANNIYENNSEGLTSYLLPNEGPYQDLPFPDKAVRQP